jgi:hypothetical protein
MNKIWIYSALACAAIILAAPEAYAQVYNSPPRTTTGKSAPAAKTAPQTCDPKYWESMSSRAWMEAQREISQNKNLIFKPDSVMEYVCFDSFMQHAAKHIGDVFTHTTYFDQQMIIQRGTQYSLENTLTKAVTDSYKTYIASNFGHKHLGERSAHLGGGVTADRTLGDASAMQSYQCNIMANIWNAAKCENLVHNDQFQNDGFFPFDDLKTPDGQVEVKGLKNGEVPDPRKFPTQCAKPNNGNYAWDKALPRATNKEDTLYQFAKPVKATYDLIRPKLKPGECSNAIATGVTVIGDVSNKTGYMDGVCSNPGCSYKKGSAGSVGRCIPN